jgi:hypothetical protein
MAISPKNTTAAIDEAFVIGKETTNARDSAKVAWVITTNFQLKDGSKERSHSCPIHEIPFMRRMYPDGEVKPEANWAPGIMRCRQVSRAEIEREIERLGLTYIIRTTGATRFLVKELLGEDPGKQLVRLHQLMHEAHNAWLLLEKQGVIRVKERLRTNAKAMGKVWDGKMPSTLRMQGLIGDTITADEMDSIVKIFDPTPDKLASIDLATIELEAPTEGEDEAITTGSSTGDKDLIDKLIANKFDKETAEEIAAVAAATPPQALGEYLGQVPGLKKGDVPNVARVKLAVKICNAFQKATAGA